MEKEAVRKGSLSIFDRVFLSADLYDQRAPNESLPVISKRWRVSFNARMRTLRGPRISNRFMPQFEVTIHGVCWVLRWIAPIKCSVIKQIAPVCE